MALLPGSRPTSHAYGGALPEDPQLAARQRRQQVEGSATSAVTGAAGLIPGVGTGIAAGLQLGQMVGGAVAAGAKDENGLYKKDNVGSRAAASLESALNPVKGISNILSVITGKRKLNDLYGIKADVKLGQDLQQQEQQRQQDAAAQQGRQVYGQLLPASMAGGGRLTGTYSTKPNVQSKTLPDRNATAEYLEQFRANPEGLQQAYGYAINDIPHPVTGKPTTYAALKQEFARNGQALYGSQAYQQGGYRDSNEYLQAVFNQGQQRLNQRAIQQPQVNVFAPADGAVAAVRRTTALSGPQVGAYDPADGRAATAALQSYGYQARGAGGAAVAPGFSGAPGQRKAPVQPGQTVLPGAGVALRKRGGLLPGGAGEEGGQKSVIASGALHSEKNGMQHPAAGKRGIPVLHAATGAKLAEIERDELTLADDATKKAESLRAGNDLLALGRHIQQEILTNTTPSARYAKRLGAQKHARGGTLVMLAPDGTKQMELGGGNRIFSREHTRELVTGSLKARDDKQLQELGKRVKQMLDQQDRNKPEYMKE